MVLDDDALVFGLDIGADGMGSALQPASVTARRGQAAWRWLHLDRTARRSREWIEEVSGLPDLVSEALLEEETRPRVSVMGEGALVILRGVNLNPGAEPEDMVSLRLFVEEHSVISLRRYRVFAVQALRETAEAGEGPMDTGAFLARLAEGLTDRLVETIGNMEDRIDRLEDASLEEPPQLAPDDIANLRREIVSYRRFLAPQRDALSKLAGLPFSWLTAEAKSDIRETLERLNRVIEVLDSIRERAAILQESLASQAAERMNRTMYILSMVAAIFLPLGFVTGLLGINVGGIPGTESSSAFAVVCLLILVLVAVQRWIFRRMRWF